MFKEPMKETKRTKETNKSRIDTCACRYIPSREDIRNADMNELSEMLKSALNMINSDKIMKGRLGEVNESQKTQN
jgi:hypothetical protein